MPCARAHREGTRSCTWRFAARSAWHGCPCPPRHWKPSSPPRGSTTPSAPASFSKLEFELAYADALKRAGGTRLARRVLRREAGAREALWATMTECGWLGTLVPEGDGGAGLGVGEAAAIAEELGRIAAPNS